MNAEQRAIALRRALHRSPEVGLHLPGTRALVEEALAGLELEYYFAERSSSFLAVLRGTLPGSAVLLRADMDALPVKEATSLDFASANGAMHACGHDLHTAGLVGAAHRLHDLRDQLHGDVAFLFQAGEEGVNGARSLLEEGLLDQPNLEWVAGLGIHVVADQPLGTVEARPGAITGTGTSISVVFRGRGGHASLPHRTRDPLPALLTALNEIPMALGRGVDAHQPVVFTPGRVHAGERRNVIPDTAEFDATMRTFDAHTTVEARRLVTRVIDAAASMHGVEADIEIIDGYPSVLVDGAEHEHACAVIAQIADVALVEQGHPQSMTEDFSRFGSLMPTWFGFVGAQPPDHESASPNHASDALFDERAIAHAIEIETQWAIARLARETKENS